MMITIFSALFAVSLGVFAARQNESSTPLQKLMLVQGYVAVPMNEADNKFTVVCRIGNETFSMLIDTGAHMSYLDIELSKRLGLVPGRERNTQMLGVTTTGHDITVRGLQIGSFDTRLVGAGTTLIASDLSSLNNRLKENKQPPIAGILGHRGFIIGSAVIDYPSHTLYLKTPLSSFGPKVQGEWIATRRVENGKVDLIDANAPRVAIKNHELTLTDGKQKYRFGFHIGPGDGCMLILFYPPGKELDEELAYRAAGLICVEGDKLRLLLGIDPTKTTATATEFVAPEGSSRLLFEFARAKPTP